MKRLILIALFLCVAVSAQAAKMEAPAPSGSGTYGDLDGLNEWTEKQTAPQFCTPLPSVKGYPDTYTVRNGSDVPVNIYAPDGLTSDANTEAVSVPVAKTADFIIEPAQAWGHVYTNEGAGALVTGTLPLAIAGMSATILDVNAGFRIALDPDAELINGVTTDQTTSAQWDVITIKCYVAGSWIVTQ
jgi:opacity protein-like surface antigen